MSDGNQQGSSIVDHPVGRLPAYFEGFAQTLQVTCETLLEWCRVHPEFSDAYKKAKAIQLQQVLDGLLSQQYNPAGAIFMLKNNHGYRDRQPDEAPNVNVAVSVTMVEGLKAVAVPEESTAVNGHART